MSDPMKIRAVMYRPFTYIFFVLSLAASMTAVSTEAQTLELFKQRLAEPAPMTGARVTATEYGDASEAVIRTDRTLKRMNFRGYRVCIFLDNGQNARAEALRAKSLFEETFPDTKVYLMYDNPYWRVTAGNCLTAEEAIILKGKVSPTFPKAFLKNEELTLYDLRH